MVDFYGRPLRWRRKMGAKRGKFGKYRVRPRRRRQLNLRTGGFLGIENKFVDFQTDSDAFALTWARMEDATFDSVSGIVQGNGESQRIGRKVTLTSIHIKYRVFANAVESQTAPQPDLVGRLVLVLDTQTNAAALTATDVMDNGQTDDLLSFRNLANTKRFRVLWDNKWKLNIGDAQFGEGAANLFAHGAVVSRVMSYNLRFKKPITVLYNATATDGTISTVVDNSLHIIGISNSTNAL